MNTTISNQPLGAYTPLFSRKKVFVPVFPNGVNPRVATNDGTTTTALLASVGTQSVLFKEIKNNTLRTVGALLSASGDEVCISWKVPDDFYGGENAHVWMVFASKPTTTTACTVSYDVVYSCAKVQDHASFSGTEAFTAPTTAMSTDCDEALNIVSDTRYAAYRGMRGTINAALVELNDFVSFKIAADAAPTGGGKIFVLGLEIDYAIRKREPTIEIYS